MRVFTYGHMRSGTGSITEWTVFVLGAVILLSGQRIYWILSSSEERILGSSPGNPIQWVILDAKSTYRLGSGNRLPQTNPATINSCFYPVQNWPRSISA